MKRYRLWCSVTHNHEMLESPDGEYVRVVDAQFEIDRLEERIENLENQLSVCRELLDQDLPGEDA